MHSIVLTLFSISLIRLRSSRKTSSKSVSEPFIQLSMPLSPPSRIREINDPNSTLFFGKHGVATRDGSFLYLLRSHSVLCVWYKLLLHFCYMKDPSFWLYGFQSILQGFHVMFRTTRTHVDAGTVSAFNCISQGFEDPPPSFHWTPALSRIWRGLFSTRNTTQRHHWQQSSSLNTLPLPCPSIELPYFSNK